MITRTFSHAVRTWTVTDDGCITRSLTNYHRNSSTCHSGLMTMTTKALSPRGYHAICDGGKNSSTKKYRIQILPVPDDDGDNNNLFAEQRRGRAAAAAAHRRRTTVLLFTAKHRNSITTRTHTDTSRLSFSERKTIIVRIHQTVGPVSGSERRYY